MIRGYDILCISSIDWDFIWQGHQEIMTTLAAQGNRIVFIENTGVRSPRLRDLPRLRQRISNWWRGIRGFRQEKENLFVFSPLILPFPYSRVARWINRYFLLKALYRWMQATGFYRPIIWTFLPTPLVIDLIDRLDPRLVIYQCLADFGEITPSPQKVSKSERNLLSRTDIVFAQGELLRQRCVPHPNVHIFPPGVNIKTFGQEIVPAPELLTLKTPIIGYVGGIHRHVDLNLVEQIALEAEGTVVLVGPVQNGIGRLKRLENVVFVGPQPHTRIPEFIRSFDVGIIPYHLTEYTKSVYPSKLNEYLAMGIPVVATDLPEIRRLNARHGEVVAVAQDSDSFAGAVREALEKNSSTYAERRIEVARQNSWEGRIARMSFLIEEALAARKTAEKRWQENFRRLYWAARRRTIRSVAAIMALYILVFYTSFVWFLAEPLRVVEFPRPADAIVVFAGGVGESGKAGGGYQERVKRAVDLYQAGNAEHLVFSSGFVFTLKEAEVMKALAVSLGVLEEAIILENQAGNTYENVTLVKRILDQKQWRSILLVSSPYHMRRAILTWNKVAPEIEVISVPVPHSQFYASEGSGAGFEQIRGILWEYLAIVIYWWRGWI